MELSTWKSENGINGLPQAEISANQLLKKRLTKYRYFKVHICHIYGITTHNQCNLLIVDDFSYAITLGQNYKLTFPCQDGSKINSKNKSWFEKALPKTAHIQQPPRIMAKQPKIRPNR